MKNKRNIIIGLLVGVILLAGGIYIVYSVMQNEDSFSVSEKKYIIDNKASLKSVSVLNDANVFGRDGKGVFYDFLDNFERETNLSFNIVTSSVQDETSGLSLTKSNELPKDARLIYTDHYVLVGKKHISITSFSNLVGTVGYLNEDSEIFQPYLNANSITTKNYDSKTALLDGLSSGEVEHILVPRLEYLDTVLSNLYEINYHISGMKDFYYLQRGDDATLNSLLIKYFNRWTKENFKRSFNKNEYDLFTSRLKITEKELDVINKKKYRYGFIKNSPYDIRVSGMYGGIASKYIQEFSEFSGITFEYEDYSNLNKFTRAISKGEVDLFLNHYSITTTMPMINSLYNVYVSFVMSNKDSRVFDSFDSVKRETIYAKENSTVASYLKNKGIEVLTYRNDRDLKNIFKNDGIVAMDYANYLIYKESNSDVNERFRDDTKTELIFHSNNDTMFNRLFSYYISTIDQNEALFTGIDDYNRAVTSGSLIYKITKYALIIIAIILLVVFIIYKIGKKAFVRKKIKKNDKMKYIDLLTSLKNRNYLNENVPIWNQNTIYPQGLVVIDLNGIQELNDSYGYIEGDKQIQAAANALIKTQLDNSEIMRTDGNEFTVYLVGYSEKQVISYVKKLAKEFKNLPHDKDAAIGFSMIEDDVKLISDAINEATEKMRENKSLTSGAKNEKKI